MNLNDLDGKIETDCKIPRLTLILLTSLSSCVVVVVFFVTGRKSSAACQRLGLTPSDLWTFVRSDNRQQWYRGHHTPAGGRSRTPPKNTPVGTRVMGVLSPPPPFLRIMRVWRGVIHLFPFPLFQIENNVTRPTPSAPAVRRTNIYSHSTYTQSHCWSFESSPACSVRISSCPSTNHVIASISAEFYKGHWAPGREFWKPAVLLYRGDSVSLWTAIYQ